MPATKIFITALGPSPSNKIAWLIQKAEGIIEEQRELVYAPEILIQSAPPSAPSGTSLGTLRRKDFLSDNGYALYYEALTGGREIHNFGGNVVEYYEQQAYLQQFTEIKYKPERKV